MTTKSIRRVALGADHAGYKVKERIKEFLQKAHYEVIDFGTHSEESVDYPDYSVPAGRAVAAAEADRAILVCGTGIGTAMAANKIPGIRAANCNDTYTARMAAEHNDANVLTVGARVVDADHAVAIVKEWLSARFQGGRHQRRLEKIAQIERPPALMGKP